MLYISEYLYTVWGSSRQKTLIQHALICRDWVSHKEPGGSSEDEAQLETKAACFSGL